MKSDSSPQEIIPGLFLGSIGAALSKSKLMELGITHIIAALDKTNCIYKEFFTYK